MVHESSGGVPIRLLVLSACVFTLGMSEFMIAGILGPMAAAFGETEPRTAMLVTAFAGAVVVSAPVMAGLTARLRPKATLVASMVVFAVAHALTAVSGGFMVAMSLRLVSGAACATFLAVGAVVAVRMVEPRLAPRAIAVMVGGLTVSNVLGLPVAAWVGHLWGWRASFWLVVTLSAVAGAALIRTRIGASTPQDSESRPRPVAEARALLRPAMLLTFAIVVLFQAGMFGTFTYLQPLAREVGGIGEGATSGLLGAFGVGSLLGVVAGGVFAPHGLLRNMIVSLIATMGSLALMMILVRGSAIAFGVAVFLFGVSAFSISAAMSGRVFELAGDAPTLASGVNISMLNLGNAVGPAVVAVVVSASHRDYLLAPLCSSVFIAAALCCATVARRLDRRRDNRGAGATSLSE